MKFKISLLLIFALQSCNDKPEKQNSQKVETSFGNSDGCYSFVNNNDSILMEVRYNDKAVSGNLTYNFYEKDDHEGTLKGEIYGDTIFAMYNFDSEGQTSAREVAFLKKGNTLVEGFGEIEEKNGEMTFKNRKFLNFDSNIILNKTDCY